ncbi:unnamed protein product [Onchocerca ochengi]|uniref:BRCT domain-containing protein n=1 Tax=Onchocerca ochengi TaxID=42157 RepID=A0A182E3Q4_ONCOC|nr:unnamed protein product [Onchocerca ochengi]
MRCPMCNMTLNKRSCASCPLLSSLLEKYLPLAKAFRKDILASDFAKENDFIESQIPMTQAVLSPLQLPQNQSRKVLKKESRSVKRRIIYPKHRSEKMQRIDELDDSSLVTGIAVNTSEGTSIVKHTSCDIENTAMDHSAKSLFKQLQMNSEEFRNGEKRVKNIGIQTDKEEMQHRSQQIDMEDAVFPSLYAERLDFSASAMHNEKIQMDNSANKTDALAQIEAIVNSVFQESENKSRIEVLIKCLPWIPNFLRLSREKLIATVRETNAEEEHRSENNPSRNDIDLVLESDEEMEVAIPTNISYTGDYCHNDVQQSKDHNIEQTTASLLKDKQYYEEDDEVYHSIMVSGASKLTDQSLLREFLDNFSSFKLSTSINRKCTYLVIFNTDGLVCEFWTVKLIYALVNHCTIVSYLWLENCLNQKSILPTSDFEILLKTDETLISVTAQRALIDPSTLFAGYVFYVPQTFFNTKLISRDVFLDIIELSGGETVSHVWELPSACSYIIFAPDCLNQDAARSTINRAETWTGFVFHQGMLYLLRFEMDVKREVLTADWVFASISQHRILDRQPYRLNNWVN